MSSPTNAGLVGITGESKSLSGSSVIVILPKRAAEIEAFLSGIAGRRMRLYQYSEACVIRTDDGWQP